MHKPHDVDPGSAPTLGSLCLVSDRIAAYLRNVDAINPDTELAPIMLLAEAKLQIADLVSACIAAADRLKFDSSSAAPRLHKAIAAAAGKDVADAAFAPRGVATRKAKGE